MTETSSRPRHSGHRVTAVLVSHDGTRWLPEVLDALAAQTRPPDLLIAADTASTDTSLDLVSDVVGPDAVVSLARDVAFGDAVQAALDAFTASPQAADDSVAAELDALEPVVEWVWLLHDDCAPDPFALEELLARVADSPSVWLAGPKVRGWGGARLLEAGLTIDATGNIDVGFDGFELDQGQRDEVDEVLAVSTAGALIRREVWDRLGGLDPEWSTYGDDIDLGWRVNAAGGRVVVATRAIVRHARAQLVGRRPSSVQTSSPSVLRRRSGMQVVLTNTATWLVPVLLARYVVGGLLRAIGLLVLSRRPARAGAELLAVVGVFLHPGVVITGRRDRSKPREVSHRELRRLFPTAGGRWRSSPFRVGRLGAYRVATASSGGSAESGPVSEESESLAIDESLVARFARRPATVLLVVMTILALVADRHVFGTALHGGRLLPAPRGSSNLWSTYFATWHPSSVGSVTPAPPSLAILALLSTIALGKVWLVIDLILLGAVPLAALSAYTASRALTAAPRIRVWIAIVYSLLPAVTGGIAGGRIDVVVVAVVLPQLIRACAGALQVEPGRRVWRRAAGAGLLLAVGAAFAPLLWVIAVPALLIAVGFAALEAEETALVRRLVAAAVVIVVPLLVLVPWSAHLANNPRLLLVGSGSPEFYTSHNAPSGLALVLLRAGGAAQPPIWITIPILAAALLGLTRRSRVAAARTGAVLLIGGVAVAVALTRGAAVSAGLPASRHWPGVALLVAGAGALLAVLVAATGARPALREQDFGWRQPAAVILVLASVVATAWLGGGWAVRGAGGPLSASSPQVLPLFISSELALKPGAPRALVLASTGPYVSYAVVRRPSGPHLGDADTAPSSTSTVAAAHLDAVVRDLVAGRPGAGAQLPSLDIEYVVVSAGSASRVQSALGRASTLTVVPAPGATVWRSSLPTGEAAVLTASAATTALRGAVPLNSASQVLPASAGSVDTAVPAGNVGRLVVLAEPANAKWRATLDGHRLVARTAYGWAQAFELPSTGGRLRINFSSGTREGWLWLELALVVVVIGASLPARRPDDLDGEA
jgi:GT2 family glycosyltransferase